jgi:hypothetical protein
MGYEAEEEGRPVSSGGQDASEALVRLCRVESGLRGIGITAVFSCIVALAFFIDDVMNPVTV